MDQPAAGITRQTVRDLVAHRPLLSFVILSYGISWLALTLATRTDLGGANGFSMIFAAGPALSGSIVWALLRPEPSGASSRKRAALFCLLAILITALLALRRLWFAAGLVTVVGRIARPVPYPALAAFLTDLLGAGAIALLLSGVHSPRRGVNDFLRSLDPQRQPVHWHWCLIAVGLYPIVVLLGNAVWTLFGMALPAAQASGPWYWLAIDAILMFLYVLIGGGGLEEPGWRGFALKRLQKRFSPIVSSLLLAVIWALWHWPLFWLGYAEGGPFGVVLFMFGAIPLAVLLTAVFNRSGGSLPVVILLHTSFNITSIYLPATPAATGLWMLMILVIAVAMWRLPEIFMLNLQEIEEKSASASL